MNSDIVDAIKYDESQVDVESIMQQIRDYLARKSGRPVSEAGPRPAQALLDGEVYEELYEANRTYDKLYVTLYLTPTRMPLMGALWQHVRAKIHGVVLFYVNRLGELEMGFNAHVIRVLNAMVQNMDEERTPEQLTALHAKVEQLEGTVRDLEARLAALEGRAASVGPTPKPPEEAL
jgi:uncharacterized coiled-coil protein SlyX